MAETALGMATTLVGSALGVASSAAREEMGLLLGVQDDIWFINVELKMMRAFLRTASVAEGNTEVLKAYLELIRELAYDTEDCLEEFMVLIKHQSLLQQCLSLRARHHIAVQIRSVKQRIQELNQTRKRYNLIQLTHTISDDMTRDFQMARNFAALYTEEAQLVGFEGPKAELLEMIYSKTDGRKVVSVVGMGGLGKTTLAKRVYDSNEIHERFVNRAWISVSQSFNIMELLKDLIKQLLGAESLKDLLKENPGMILQVQHFTDHLTKKLRGKRYFVVLDDLWTTEAWNSIRFAFPTHSSEDGCVVVTTRNSEVAEVCSSPYLLIHHLKALAKEDARELLLKKLHKPRDPEEDKLLDEILKKCGGLPLAIVTIGGLLANKGINEWKSLRNQLPSELTSSNASLEALRQVVTLSYNHLPSHLKPCFLYLSLFPEDFEISRKHLVNRWIAEGFITSGTDRRTLEEVAESYFYELISRSMIQSSKIDILGNIKTCRIHDIVRDIAVTISRQENHVFLVDEQTSNTMGTKESIRHISLFASRKWNIGMDLNRVRSFTLFSEPLESIASLCSSKFKMLRVLDLKNAEFSVRQQDIQNIVLLLHLKYLHFPGRSSVYALPGSIGNLHGLQTLDIRKSNFATLPTAITKLKDLRSLQCSRTQCAYFSISELGEWPCDALDLIDTDYAIADLHMGFSSCWSGSSGIKVPKGVGGLKELQVLEKVDIKRTSRKAIKELGELTQLRKLVVRGRRVSKKKCKTFCEAMEKLSSLRSLNVSTKERGKDAETLDMLVSYSCPLPCLETLKLKGHLLEIPAWVGKCGNLVKIDFKYCELKELEAIAVLPNLTRLRLYHWSYSSQILVFRKDAFPKLRVLQLGFAEALREVTFEESTSPNMERISIAHCKLTSGINGIKHLPKLREISIFRVELAKKNMLREEVYTHPNHPLLR
ncbi:putative disease resistance RPP13-like protein 3 [Phragmites australis]|uniref:putative disease resistance RPP13-like protein 3 n=1 Tax=Phragmites australis TaxID=29695 RepID=UPI002D79B7C3|nr:putative disease resistance RPP13-like protein 3 [Phragmites australis]